MPAGEPCEIGAPATTLTGKITWSAKNLPKGLKINSKTGVISGTPTVPGAYVVKVTAYDGANDAALTFSFTKTTGIFKGSFTCWYDYDSSIDSTKDPEKVTQTHTSKKVSYEGVMVLGESLRGFYLWDRTGTYEDDKGKTKTYKYKESKPVIFE